MKINLSDLAKVRLTQTGVDHLKRQGLKYVKAQPTVAEDGVWEIELWKLMRLFGSQIDLSKRGQALPFVDCDIEITSTDPKPSPADEGDEE